MVQCLLDLEGQSRMTSQLICLVLIASVSVATANSPKPLSQSMINYINNLPGNTWKAGENFKGWTLVDVKKLCGTLISKDKLPMKYHTIAENEMFPESFDPRDKWPNCPTLRDIRDQGFCGSCWAFGAVSAMSDRICIATNGKVQVRLSAEDVLQCCYYCGLGCFGGYPRNAWRFYYYSGIVTGGGYGSNEGCLPYTYPFCSHHTNGTEPPCMAHFPIIDCTKKCRDGYEKSYYEDKHYANVSYSVSSKPEQIMMELIKYGPIEVDFTVYEDFLSYKSGVYKHVAGNALGGHAVKLLGWGVENGTDYWLLANSWNSEWGDNGYFKMLRGSNECGIESHGVAGTPKEDY